MVNAPVAARDHGIDVAETVHDRDSEYQTLVRVTVETDQLTRSVAGTLFAGSRPRIVEIKGIKVEADFAPHMLYVTNQDKPGFIGRFGATLAGAGINIATFHLGPRQPGRRCDLPRVGGREGAGGRAVDGAHLAAGGAGDLAGVLSDGGQPRLSGFHPGPARPARSGSAAHVQRRRTVPRRRRCSGCWCATRCICGSTTPRASASSAPAAARSATCVASARSVCRPITWCRRTCWIGRMSCCNGRAMPSQLLGEQLRCTACHVSFRCSAVSKNAERG